MNTVDHKKFQNKTVVVTGGTSGIGYATVKLFLEHGAKVIFTGHDPKRLQSAEENLKKDFDSDIDVSGVLADATSVTQLTELAEVVKIRFEGHLDVLFLNAGTMTAGFMEHLNESAFDLIFGVNVKGTFFTLQKLAPLLVSGSSVIVNLSTIHSQAVPANPLYAASKAAERSLVRSMSRHLAPRGIRVNAVSPGFVPETDIFKDLPHKADGSLVHHDQIISRIPFNRPATLKEVCEPILFLASDSSSYMTGADICVDGGTAS